MKLSTQSLFGLAGTALALPGLASELDLTLTLPGFDNGGRGARRPYVAIWLQRADQSFAANLAVWYQTGGGGRRGGGFGGRGGGGGARYLNELRQWWSDSGNRIASFPVDGLTSASRAAGVHEVVFSSGQAPLNKLPAGNYRLMVEASREHGGLEAVTIPFSWPARTQQTLTASGRSELGALSLTIKP